MVLGVRKETVTCIFENPRKEVLLMLRDDDPSIPFANTWYIPGGIIEPGDDSARSAMIREIQEEFQIILHRITEWKSYEWDDKNETVFVEKQSLLNPKKIDLQEGQEIRFFTRKQVEKMDLAFHDNDIMRDYFNKWKLLGNNNSST